MSDPTPKIHPATREMLPEDPLEMTGIELPGDPELMLRLLVEEYARLGFDGAAITRLACDANYQAFDGLRRFFGDEQLNARIHHIVSRCGVMRVTAREAPAPAQLVQIELS